MPRLRLILWNPAEARQRARELRAHGFQVSHELPGPPELVRVLRRRPPDAIVIDLTRLPSQGRDLGLLLRKSASLRHVPLVFVGGAAEKARAVRRLLPDATFTTWGKIDQALRRALAHPPTAPVVPTSVFAAFEGRPLALKLGSKAGMRIALVAAPRGFAASLGRLPDRASVVTGRKGSPDLILWFVRTLADLSDGIQGILARSGDVPLWILWPKKSSSGPKAWAPASSTTRSARSIPLGRRSSSRRDE